MQAIMPFQAEHAIMVQTFQKLDVVDNNAQEQWDKEIYRIERQQSRITRRLSKLRISGPTVHHPNDRLDGRNGSFIKKIFSFNGKAEGTSNNLQALPDNCNGEALTVESRIAFTEKVGEDAVGYGNCYHTLADGVGGTAASSAPLAQALVQSVLEELKMESERQGSRPLSSAKVRAAFLKGADIARSRCIQFGKLASTLNVVYIDSVNSEMHSIVVGDSKTLLIREGAIVWESTSLTHEFNLPATVSTDLLIDHAKQAICSTVKVQKGDLIISCSDGVSDNLFADELTQLVVEHEASGCQALAEEIVRAAYLRATAFSVRTPFTAAAVKAYYDRVLEIIAPNEGNHVLMNAHRARALAMLTDWEPYYHRSLEKEMVKPNGYRHYKIQDLARLAQRTQGKMDDITVCVSAIK